LACGALVLLVLAVVRERRAAEPILPPRLFRQPAFVVASAISVMAAANMLGTTVFTPHFLQEVHGLRDSGSGLMLMPLSGGATVGAVAAGRLVAATGRYKLFPVVGLGVNAAAMLLLADVAGATPLALTSGYLALAGIGLGMVMPVMLVAVQNVVDPRDLGAGTASVNLFRSLGGAFGVALFGAILRASAPPGAAAVEAAQSFHSVFRVGALIAVAALAIALFLRETPLRTTAGATQEAGVRRRQNGARA
jgi:predicted MFS family arabinose efflux permease